MKQESISEGMRTKLNQQLFTNYGNRLVISKAVKKNNDMEVIIDYRRIVHMLDSSTNTIYVRNIHFPDIYVGDLNTREKLKLPLDEINQSIDNKYAELRTDLKQGIISNQKVLIPLIKRVPLFTAFLNKFNDVISALVYDDIITKDKIDERISVDENYSKYIDVVLKSKYAVKDSKGNLKASEKLKILHKDRSGNKNFILKDLIDEVLFNIIKDNYDYIIHDLKLRILSTYVKLLSCLNYVTVKNNLSKVSMKIEDLLRVYRMLYDNILDFKFEERINYLTSAGIINKEKGVISWASMGA